MKPPKDRTLTKPGSRNDLDPQAVQLAHDEVVKLFKEGLGFGLFHNGVMFLDLELDPVAGEVQLFHGLGRVPTVVLAVRIRGASYGHVVHEGSPHANPRQYVNIVTNAPVTANVIVA